MDYMGFRGVSRWHPRFGSIWGGGGRRRGLFCFTFNRWKANFRDIDGIRIYPVIRTHVVFDESESETVAWSCKQHHHPPILLGVLTHTDAEVSPAFQLTLLGARHDGFYC